MPATHQPRLPFGRRIELLLQRTLALEQRLVDALANVCAGLRKQVDQASGAGALACRQRFRLEPSRGLLPMERGRRVPQVDRPPARQREDDSPCAEFGIFRKAGFKIRDRYKLSGLEALTDRKRRPYRQGNQLPPLLEHEIVRLKRAFPS